MPHHLRTNSTAIFGVLVLLSAAVKAQDGGADATATSAAAEPGAVRIYHCNMPVLDLADVLRQVADGREVIIVPERINNVLIVRASEAELERFDALVRELNRPAPRMMFTLTVLEVDDSRDVEHADPNELLRTLLDENPAARIREIRLSAIENNLAQVQFGEQRPVVNGASFGRSGERFNSYQQEEFGTLLTVTARVGDEGEIVAQLSFEMSRLDESIGATESADDGRPATKRVVTLQTTVSIPDGEPVLLTDFGSQDSPGDTRLIGIVTATTEQGQAQARGASSEDRVALEARRFFGILDRDDDGVLSSEEWEQSVRIRGMFEDDGLDLSQPMSADEFLENYVRLSNARDY